MYFSEEYPEQLPLSQAELLRCFGRRRAAVVAGRGRQSCFATQLGDCAPHSVPVG